MNVAMLLAQRSHLNVNIVNILDLIKQFVCIIFFVKLLWMCYFFGNGLFSSNSPPLKDEWTPPVFLGEIWACALFISSVLLSEAAAGTKRGAWKKKKDTSARDKQQLASRRFGSCVVTTGLPLWCGLHFQSESICGLSRESVAAIWERLLINTFPFCHSS